MPKKTESKEEREPLIENTDPPVVMSESKSVTKEIAEITGQPYPVARSFSQLITSVKENKPSVGIISLPWTSDDMAKLVAAVTAAPTALRKLDLSFITITRMIDLLNLMHIIEVSSHLAELNLSRCLAHLNHYHLETVRFSTTLPDCFSRLLRCAQASRRAPVLA